ncbi:MAG: energy transducer TonB [Bacteroidales bacterium]|nr:energy transducer TonB [Bacteroidales bacterium]
MKKILLLFVSLFLIGNIAIAQDDDDISYYDSDIESDAEFPGGLEELYMFACMNVEYPKEAREANIEGKVYVSFTVGKDGSVANIKLLKDIGYGCGEAVVKMVQSMPRWKPAMRKNGNPVRVQFSLPVNFILADDEELESKEVRCRTQAKLISQGYNKSAVPDE